MDTAVLALGDLAAHGLAVVDLGAIGAEIEPAVVGVLRHRAVGGADEARLVELVMARHRKFQHIDLVALDHVLQDRPVIDEAGRQRFELRHARVIALHHVDLALVFERQPERERHAADGREVAVKGAKTLRISGNLVEQDRRRRVARLLGEHVGDSPHLDIPMGAIDMQQLAHPVDFIEPGAQATVLDFAL